jgi:hypothetical protein
MDRFRQVVFTLTIPLNIALVLWAWVSRGLFGVTVGWILAFFTVTALPVLIVALTVTTVLGRRQPPRRPRLTAPQAWTQASLWLALLLFGATIVDVNEVDHDQSILTEAVGFSTRTLAPSTQLQNVSAIATMVLWFVLLAALIRGRRTQTVS